MKLDRKQAVFILVILLLIGSIIYRVQHPFVQKRVDKLTYTGKVSGNAKPVLTGKKEAFSGDASSVVSGFFEAPPVSGKVYKNLFGIYRPPQPAVTAPRKDLNTDFKPRETQKDPVNAVRDYIYSFKLYGTYKSGNKRAVFLEKDKLVLVARKGDRLLGKYLIDDIQDNFIRIKVLELNEMIQLDMREFNNE